MNFSPLELIVAVLLTVVASRICRPNVSIGSKALGFLLGSMVVFPVARLNDLIAHSSLRVTGHYYFDELIEMMVATALPEEIGKGLAVLVLISLARSATSASAWLACGAAVHCGFAAVEGLLSALGNEGFLKVLIGRSLGAITHCSWGIIMAGFLWRGWVCRERRWGNWTAALLVPALLHALTNASMVEAPGTANLPEETMPPAAALLIMLSGIAVFLASIGWAAWFLISARGAVEPNRNSDSDQQDKTSQRGVSAGALHAREAKNEERFGAQSLLLEM